MRSLLLAALLAACTSTPDVQPDAAPTDPDASLSGNGTATWPCYFWDGETKCAPKCADKTLLGRLVWGEHNTCSYGPDGAMCPTENMTGPADSGNAGCCVVVGAEVDFYGCM